MEANRTDDNKAFATPESKLHFLDYWRIIRIRKTVILAVFLLVALTTTVVTFLLPPAYKSMVKISIEQDMTDVDPQQRGILVRPMVDPFFVQTEFQRIQSKPVLYKVITNLHLCEEWGRKYNQGVPISNERAYNYLKGSIDVQQSHNTTLIEIHGFSDDKDEAANIANTVAEVYTEVRSQARSNLKQGGVDALRKMLLSKEEAITNQQKVVNGLRASLEIADWEAAANQPTPSLDQETLRQINAGLRDAMRSFDITTNVYAKLVVLPREALKEAAPLQVPNATRLIELINQENSTEQKLATLQGRQLGSEHPDVLSSTELLKTIRRQLNEALSGLTNALEIRMQTERATVQGYRNQLDQAKNEDKENYAKTRPYYEARDVLAQMKYNRERLAQTVENTEVELNMPSKGAVQIIEMAEANPVPYKPKKGVTIGIGVAAGLLIGLLLAFFIEYLDTSVKTIDDVERALQAPVLGVIPQNVGLLMNEGAESPHAEAYRVLRTNVLFSRKDPKLNTLTIVSGGAGEGKSTTIFNLATVFAQNGQRILVVDSDLRRPSLHKHLGVSNALGLTNYLLKQNSLDEVVQTTKQTNLDFLPSGRLPSSSMGILSSMQMKELIRDVKRRYDFVFFDSPPIMGVSDASILASEVDMVLQVIQYRRYPQPMTIRAKQMIEKVGGNLLGIVLNNINVSQDENYYYYSGYYYDYTKGDDGDVEKKQEAKAAAKEAKVEIKSKF